MTGLFGIDDVVVVKDWRHDVTKNDLGSNHFSGNNGTINDRGFLYSEADLDCDTSPCGLRFDWNFTISSDANAFTGYFFSLRGLTQTRATFDGRTVEDVSFPEHTLNLDDVLGPVGPGDGSRRADSLLVDLDYSGGETLTLRLELQGPAGETRFVRFRIVGSPHTRSLQWDFRQTGTSGAAGVDLTRVKVVALVIERRHVGDGIVNPDQGTLLLRRIALRLDRALAVPTTDEAVLDEAARYAAQHFLTWFARSQGGCVGSTPDGRTRRHGPGAVGFAQDRSSFADLLTVGGTGFALPAYVIAAERGYLPRADAAALTLGVLRVAGDAAGFGSEPVGRIGYRGWLYHFLGCDGRRKLNFDDPETTGKNEALNTVELSTIDTALFVAGALVAQQYFNGGSPDEIEIRRLAQDVYDRVEWPFMLDTATRQYYLGWKPLEARDELPRFRMPDREGRGHYSSTTDGKPQTLDYYTDEALLVVALAAGSRTWPVSVPADQYCALNRTRNGSELIKTWPGSLFTYSFMHAYSDTRTSLFPACPGDTGSIDWFANSRLAFTTAIREAEQNAAGFATYGKNAWGLNAAEGFDDEYRAFAVPALARTARPDQDGTITYYGMLSAASYGDDLRQRAVAAVRHARNRGHWHPVVGLPDAFNDRICESSAGTTVQCAGNAKLLRTTGPWVHWATFAIDQGPMLLHLENQRSGLIWQLFRENENIRRATDRLSQAPAPAEILLEAEAGTGAGAFRHRSNASGLATTLIRIGETRYLSFSIPSAARYGILVRYSNDHYGPTDEVEVSVDGRPAGRFSARSTGSGGHGWNAFEWSAEMAAVDLTPGAHRVEVTLLSGDNEGIEIDVVRLVRR